LDPARRDVAVAAFRALGDATRLDMFRLIAAQRAPVCVCDVVSCFGLSQPTISHHLKALREAGLVRATKRGLWSYYEALPLGVELLRFVELADPSPACAEPCGAP
jgi:ArsR family transcriptional regulator